MAKIPDRISIKVKVDMEMAPNVGAAIAARSIFPKWSFTVRKDGESCHLDRLDEDGRVTSTRPCSPETYALYMAQGNMQEQLLHLLTAKAVELQTVVDRCADYDNLLREALRFAPGLAKVPNGLRLEMLRSLTRGEKHAEQDGHRAKAAQKWPEEHMLEAAWKIIANAFEGDWSKAPAGWREAAIRWGESFHQQIAITQGDISDGPGKDGK